jgi:hypothetical protein
LTVNEARPPEARQDRFFGNEPSRGGGGGHKDSRGRGGRDFRRNR